MKSLCLTVILSLPSLFLLSAFAQTPSGVVVGEIHGPDGSPSVGVRVAVVQASKVADRQMIDSDLMSIAQTDKTGLYRLENIPPGKYYIVADPIGNPKYYPGGSDISTATVITIVAGSVVRAAEFKFAPWSNILKSIRHSGTDQTGRFFGRILSTAGTPLQNVALILSDAQSGMRFMSGTDHDGAFEFTGLPQSPLSLDILSAVETGFNSQGYEHLKTSIELQPRESIELDIRLRLLVSTTLARSRPDLYTALTVSRSGPPSVSTGSVRTISGGSQDRIPRPRSAGLALTEESVQLQGIVGTDGHLISLRVVNPGTNPILARSAIETVSHWSFPKATIRGEPINLSGAIMVTFAPSD